MYSNNTGNSYRTSAMSTLPNVMTTTAGTRPMITTMAGGASTRAAAGQHHTVQSERVLSSNIVNETMLGPMPQEENVQYVEIPVIEEVVRHIPKKEFVEVEKRIPKFEYEWVEKIVEVPQIHVVEKVVEVPHIQEVLCHVPIKQVVEIPKEIIRRVPKIETKIVEKEVEVPGEIIEVPKPYLVENKIVIPRYTNKEVPTVVAQRLVPIITESETDFVDVDLKEYNPYLVPVDVYVPRPVARQLIASSKTEEHRVVDVPVGQFNALVKQLNTHCQDTDIQELLVKDPRSGAIPVMPITAGSLAVQPVSTEWESQHSEGTMHYSHNASVGTIITASAATAASPSYMGGSVQKVISSSPSVYTGAATGTGRVHQSLTSYQQGGYSTGGTTYQSGTYQAAAPSYPLYQASSTAPSYPIYQPSSTTPYPIYQAGSTTPSYPVYQAGSTTYPAAQSGSTTTTYQSGAYYPSQYISAAARSGYQGQVTYSGTGVSSSPAMQQLLQQQQQATTYSSAAPPKSVQQAANDMASAGPVEMRA